MTAMIANDFLVCPECETPAIQASSATNDLPCWTEDDADVWCPGCGCLLRVFLTGDCQGSEWYEARVAEYSGRDWRREIESALGFDSMPISRTPEHLADVVRHRLDVARDVARDVLVCARDALDSLMGDSDIDGDNSQEFRALCRVRAALKETEQ